MKKCINCGRFPFCEKIKNSQQNACENFLKRPLGVEVTKLNKEAERRGKK